MLNPALRATLAQGVDRYMSAVEREFENERTRAQYQEERAQQIE